MNVQQTLAHEEAILAESVSRKVMGIPRNLLRSCQISLILDTSFAICANSLNRIFYIVHNPSEKIKRERTIFCVCGKLF